MRVTELARKAGVSASLISQIERGHSRPSVGTLFALGQVFGVPIDTFFDETPSEDDPNAPGPTHDASGREGDAALPSGSRPVSAGWAGESRSREVVRRHERAAADIRGGVRWERLTATPLDGVEFLELVYAPGAESDTQLYRHPGVELVLVTEGTMTIFLGFDRHDLNPGDSIAFPSSTPHRYVNFTENTTSAITVILRDDLSTLAIRDTQATRDDALQPVPATGDA
jgi:transcriptional regulator with XRE-family HTH domain